jgi:hypothetical protein
MLAVPSRVAGRLSCLGQPDQVYQRRVPAFLARSAFQGCFELPDRGITRPADRIKRQARPRLAAVTLDLQPP